MEPSPEIAKQGWSKNLADCDPRIRDAFGPVREEFCASFPGHDLHVDYTYRSPALQMELYKKGRTQDATGQWVLTDRSARVTDKDGTVKKGKHNYYPSLAADIYVTAGGHILWGVNAAEQSLYVALGGIWKKHGLASGALWATFKDWPHVEV